MIKHIVMWRLKEEVAGVAKAENARRMKAMLEALPAKIPAIGRLEVGINFAEGEAAADVALYSEFASTEGLATYIKHPEHLKCVEFIRTVVSERRIADYEL